MIWILLWDELFIVFLKGLSKSLSPAILMISFNMRMSLFAWQSILLKMYKACLTHINANTKKNKIK